MDFRYFKSSRRWSWWWDDKRRCFSLRTFTGNSNVKQFHISLDNYKVIKCILWSISAYFSDWGRNTTFSLGKVHNLLLHPPMPLGNLSATNKIKPMYFNAFNSLGSREVNSIKNSSPDYHSGMAQGCQKRTTCSGAIRCRPWQRRCKVPRRSNEYCQNHLKLKNLGSSKGSLCKACCWCCT